jgi:hypothetical protein
MGVFKIIGIEMQRVTFRATRIVSCQKWESDVKSRSQSIPIPDLLYILQQPSRGNCPE